MTNTTEIRKLMLKVASKPSRKNLGKLICLVSDLCDDYDKQPDVLDVINKNQESIQNTFSFITTLRGQINGE